MLNNKGIVMIQLDVDLEQRNYFTTKAKDIHKIWLKLPLIPSDSPIIHEAILREKEAEFESPYSEVNFGVVEVVDGGFKYTLTQSGEKDEVFFAGKVIDMFVVKYFFNSCKETRKQIYNPHIFTGNFSLKKSDYDLEIMKKIGSHFGKLFEGAKLFMIVDNTKIPYFEYDPNTIDTNEYGIIKNQKYILESPTPMEYYHCIKLNAYLFYPFNKTYNPELYRIFEKYYLSRQNIFKY